MTRTISKIKNNKKSQDNFKSFNIIKKSTQYCVVLIYLYSWEPMLKFIHGFLFPFQLKEKNY